MTDETPTTPRPLILAIDRLRQSFSDAKGDDVAAINRKLGHAYVEAANGRPVEPWLTQYLTDIEIVGLDDPVALRRTFRKASRRATADALDRLRDDADVWDLDQGLTTAADWTQDATGRALLWGTPDRELALDRGRYMLLFGSDGAGKTNLALLLAAGALGAPGFETLLGYPVTPLDETEGVLLIAADGPAETAASVARLTVEDGAKLTDWAGPRLTVWRGSPPFGPEADEAALPGLVSAIEDKTRQAFGLVIVDNALSVFGDVSQPTRGGVAKLAADRLSDGGRSVVIVAQSKKSREPRDMSDANVSTNLISGAGTVLSLYGPKEGAARLRHYKGKGRNPRRTVDIDLDLDTGRMVNATEAAASKLKATERKLAEALPARWTPTAEVVDSRRCNPDDASKATIERRLRKLLKADQVERRGSSAQGYEWRGVPQ